MKNQSDNSTDHIFKWFLPTSIRSRTRYFEFDITSHCRLFFAKEEYFTRQVDFDKQYTISKATIENITSVKLKIYPCTDAPMSNTHEARQIIEKEIGTFPDFQHIIDRGNLRHAHGLVIAEIDFTADVAYVPNLKLDEEKDIEKVLNWNLTFDRLKLEVISIANDICSFFMLGLHLTYPTHSTDHGSTKPQSSGLISFQGNSRYIMDVHSDMLAYPLLIEEHLLPDLDVVLSQIGQDGTRTFGRFTASLRRFVQIILPSTIFLTWFL